MSRNKDIQFLHQVTGWTYKECRRKYRENGYDLWKTLPFNSQRMNEILEASKQAIEALSMSVQQVCDTLKTAIMSVDWQKLVQAAKEAKKDGLI